MKAQENGRTIKWLLDGDIAIQYQVYRDLLDIQRDDLRDRISKEGWGGRFISLRNKNGHWGKEFYQPKWTSTHYTLLELKNLCISPNIKEINEIINLVLNNSKCIDGGIGHSNTALFSDVCINGMFLNYAAYFKANEMELESVIDFILSEQMMDGGFNCYSNRIGATHSSLHTTLSVLEGILEYRVNGYKYKLGHLQKAEMEARKFILKHRLFKSDRTGGIIKPQFTRLSYPSRWYYDILRALDYFTFAKVPYDESMQDAIDIILKKRKKDNMWTLQSNHKGLVHFEMEKVGMPSRWNTLRSMRVLKHFEIDY